MASFCNVSILFVSCLLFSSHLCLSMGQTPPPLEGGMSWTFYKTNCPNVEKIVRNQLKKVFKKDIGQAAGLLRLHFHDCFVSGCDGSVLLDDSPGNLSEKNVAPNQSLRAQAFRIVNDLRQRIHKRCGQVVSCADIVALAARDSIFLSGGPTYQVPLGRRDGLTAATNVTVLNNLLPPNGDVDFLMTIAGPKNFSLTDLVAISGAHTIGIAHCTSFEDRLFPNQDPVMNITFANHLRSICPTRNSTNTTSQDIRTPNTFDNKYYVDLINRQGLFTSDQDLFTNNMTKPIVNSFAVNQSLFFEKFVLAMIKMGQLNVLTGRQGEIRANCSARNPTTAYLSTVVDGEGKSTEV